jgi:hypothetical protein
MRFYRGRCAYEDVKKHWPKGDLDVFEKVWEEFGNRFEFMSKHPPKKIDKLRMLLEKILSWENLTVEEMKDRLPDFEETWAQTQALAMELHGASEFKPELIKSGLFKSQYEKILRVVERFEKTVELDALLTQILSWEKLSSRVEFEEHLAEFEAVWRKFQLLISEIYGREFSLDLLEKSTQKASYEKIYRIAMGFSQAKQPEILLAQNKNSGSFGPPSNDGPLDDSNDIRNKDSQVLERQAKKMHQKANEELLNSISLHDKTLSEEAAKLLYERVKKLFYTLRHKEPPILFFRDCHEGSVMLKNLFSNDEHIPKGFTLSINRRGKFKAGRTEKIVEKGKVRILRFVRMHSVLSLIPNRKCKKYFGDMVFDYLEGTIYTKRKFEEEYYLDVTYAKPGYYEVEPDNIDKLKPNQVKPVKSTIGGI